MAGPGFTNTYDGEGNLNVNVQAGGGGGGGTVNQGNQGTAAEAWFVEVTDGTNVLGTPTHPLRIDPTGTTVQPVSGTVTATNPSVGATAAAVPADATYVGANQAGNLVGLSLDGSGFLKVNVAAGSSGNAAASATGAAVPADADYTGLNIAGNLQGQTGVNPSGSVFAAQEDITSIGGSTVATSATGVLKVGNVGNAGAVFDGAAGSAIPANSLQIGGSDGTNLRALLTDTSGQLKVLVENFPATQPVSGTVAVTQSTSPWVVAGNLTNNNANPTANNIGVLPAVANTGAPTYTQGDQVLLSTDLSGNLRVNVTNAILSTSTLLVGGSATIGKVDILGNTGAVLDAAPGAAAPANALQVGGTDGTDLRALLTDNTGQLKVLIENTPAVTLASTTITGTVDIVGHAGATMDGTNTAASAPANGILTLVKYSSSAPSPTNGQSVATQCDTAGNSFVRTYRRSGVAGKATTISGTSPTTVIAAPGANLFADVGSLVITVTPQAATGEAITATLSDGTNSYIFDLFTGVTATLASVPLAITFNPPLPATTVNTAWTITISTVTTQPTVHITTVAVLQGAS